MANRGRQVIPKTQRELAEGLHTAYVNPDNNSSTQNPNLNNPSVANRANQISFRGDDTKPFSIG